LRSGLDGAAAGDKNGHPAGDVFVAIVIVLIVFAVWDFATRKSPSRREGAS
jgi:hypothetical protein